LNSVEQVILMHMFRGQHNQVEKEDDHYEQLKVSACDHGEAKWLAFDLTWTHTESLYSYILCLKDRNSKAKL